MRFSATITILTLVLSANAYPSSIHTKRQRGGDSQVIIDAINQWRADVEAFNTFVDGAATLSDEDVGNAAFNLKPTAANEFKHIKPLSSIEGFSQKTLDSIETLRKELGFNIMENLLDGIANVAFGPDSAEQIDFLLVEMNGIRCCNVLPNLDIFWEAAATSSGIADLVDLKVPRPLACSNPSVCTPEG